MLVAAGSAHRMGGVDKVWTHLGATSVVECSLSRLLPAVECVVVVVHSNHLARAQATFKRLGTRVRVVEGGRTRQESVYRGLQKIDRVSVVAVHDAARPFADVGTLRTGVGIVENSDGAVPSVSLVDTIKEVDVTGQIVRTVERDALKAVQTPQVFQRNVLLACHSSGVRDGIETTDDSALLEAYGYRVKVYAGSSRNFKITTPFDLELARWLVSSGRESQ